jgi:Flp pilus assembly protein TadG
MYVPYSGAMQERDGERGQGLVELALTLPIFFFVLLAGLQFSLIVMHDYGVRYVARETARWLAINPDTTDSALTAQARSIAMPGMRAASMTGVAATPACPSLSSGRCTNRAPGENVTVEIRYDLASSALFLPTEFGFWEPRLRLPTALPPRRVTVMVE